MESISRGDIYILSVFAGFESLYTPSAMLPSLMTINTFVDSPEKAKMIRRGMLISAATNIAFGIVLSYLSKSWLPFLFTIIATAFIMGVYESALRTSPTWRENGGIL